MGFEVSDTTLRARRDEWIAAGVFDELCKEALAAFDRIVGLDLEEVALDGSLHKAPCGGEGTGPNPTDRAKIGWKWSVATACRSAGRSAEPTATTSACWSPPSAPSPPPGSSKTSEPYTWTGAMTIPLCAAASPRSASTTSTSNAEAPNSQEPTHRPGSGSAGSSNPPTPGCRTTDNSAATPTAEAPTATLPYASPPPCSSSANYSPTETAGAPNERLSAQPLRAIG